MNDIIIEICRNIRRTAGNMAFVREIVVYKPHMRVLFSCHQLNIVMSYLAFRYTTPTQITFKDGSPLKTPYAE